MDRDQLIEKLRAQRPLLLREHVRALALFGSAARGEARADCDVDLLVDFEPNARVSLLAVCRLERLLSEALGASHH